MFEFTARNDPNPARLIESLRHIGYSNYEAVADIVDNSFDADASKVVITVGQKRGDFLISIGDDGSGMDPGVLDQALRLGSMIERDPSTDLGKFGMGLVTAGLSLARRTTVVTRQNGECWTSVVDVDEIMDSNTFCKHHAPSTEEETALLEEGVPNSESGTLVILSKCDGITNRNTTQFANILRKHLGEVHRHFLMAGKTILVNGEEAPAIDPLMLNHPDTTLFSDELYPFEIEQEDERVTENVRMRIALIPLDAAAGDMQIAKTLGHQGFYGLRNNRQIFRAQTLDLFPKHNDWNRMRGEIFFTGRFDTCIGIEFTKRQVVFDQRIHDKLVEYLKGQCYTIKRMEAARGAERVSGEHAEFHEQASRAITQKSRLLVTPRAIIEKRGPRTVSKKPKADQEAPTGRERKHFKITQQGEPAPRVKFLTHRLGPGGQIFECDQEGRTVVIRWNIEHPFYKRFILDNSADGRLITATDFLVYSMACAELVERRDDNIEFMNNMKSVISANLRTLLS